MNRPLHHRAFLVSVGWTLCLLLLGSVVHATESSLACPDWPTCYGTMVPEMTGGIFWEHLHRLVAGGLILMWILATYLVWEPSKERPWLRTATVGGLVLLLVQAVLGGITVILLLPDAVSTAHLGLAFAFLVLATVMAVTTGRGWDAPEREASDLDRPPEAEVTTGSIGGLRAWLLVAGGLVFLQSLLGAWVRHADAGLACPGVPLCLGEWVPPLEQGLIALHFFHRALGVALVLVVIGAAVVAFRRSRDPWTRRGAVAAGVLVVLQATLGFLSVTTFLAVVPVSLHTLVAAALLTVLAAMATWCWRPSMRETTSAAKASV